MDIEKLKQANKLEDEIKLNDKKIDLLNKLDFSGSKSLEISDSGSQFKVSLDPRDIGYGTADKIRDYLWDALLSSKAKLLVALKEL